MIIKSYKKCREGNDCLITDDVKVVKMSAGYAVIHETSYYGSWTPDIPNYIFHGCADEQSAMSVYDTIVSQVG